MARSSCPRAASSSGGTWLSTKPLALPGSRSTRPLITDHANGSETRTHSMNASSATSPSVARSSSCAGTVNDMATAFFLVPGSWGGGTAPTRGRP